MHVIFLCSGNTCRSPMAAGLFSLQCAARGLDMMISSAGLGAWPGDAAAENAVAAAQELGADISSHRAARADAALLAQADVVVCMAASHARAVSQLLAPERIRILGCGVADPYGGNMDTYRACARQINDALPSLFPDLLCPAQIIPTEPAHLPALAELERLVFFPPASEARLHEKLDLPHCHMYTALLEDQVAGFIGADEIAGEVFIDDVAVFPANQRRGIASALLARAEVSAILRGCTAIHLECREGNAPALALYRARGYKIVGRRAGFYDHPKEDAILMTAQVA